MSSDNVKENASVADSTVTEWKNGRGNLDEPGNADAKSLHNSVIGVGFSGIILLISRCCH